MPRDNFKRLGEVRPSIFHFAARGATTSGPIPLRGERSVDAEGRRRGCSTAGREQARGSTASSILNDDIQDAVFKHHDQPELCTIHTSQNPHPTAVTPTLVSSDRLASHEAAHHTWWRRSTVQSNALQVLLYEQKGAEKQRRAEVGKEARQDKIYRGPERRDVVGEEAGESVGRVARHVTRGKRGASDL